MFGKNSIQGSYAEKLKFTETSTETNKMLETDSHTSVYINVEIIHLLTCMSAITLT